MQIFLTLQIMSKPVLWIQIHCILDLDIDPIWIRIQAFSYTKTFEKSRTQKILKNVKNTYCDFVKIYRNIEMIKF